MKHRTPKWSSEAHYMAKMVIPCIVLSVAIVSPVVILVVGALDLAYSGIRGLAVWAYGAIARADEGEAGAATYVLYPLRVAAVMIEFAVRLLGLALLGGAIVAVVVCAASVMGALAAGILGGMLHHEILGIYTVLTPIIAALITVALSGSTGIVLRPLVTRAEALIRYQNETDLVVIWLIAILALVLSTITLPHSGFWPLPEPTAGWWQG